MYRTISILILSILVMSTVPVSAADDFEPVLTEIFESQHYRPDARSLGMGSAFSAVAEGPAGLWWNPAAVREGHSLSGGYVKSDLITDNLERVAYAASVELGYFRFGATQAELTNDLSIGMLDIEGTLSECYQTAGASLDVSSLLAGRSVPLILSVGANYKWFEKTNDSTLGLDEYKLEDYDVGAIVGWKSKIRDVESGQDWWGWRFGGVLTNVDKAEIVSESNLLTRRLSSWLRVGAAIEGRHGWTDRMGHLVRWVVSAEQESEIDPIDDDEKTMQRYGAEVTIFGMFSARIGWDDRGEGSPYGGLTHGGSLQADPTDGWLGFRLDYASVEVDSDLSEAETLEQFGAAVWLKF